MTIRTRLLVSVIGLPLLLITLACPGQSQSQESQDSSSAEETAAEEQSAERASAESDEASHGGWDRDRYRELMATMGAQISDQDLDAMEANMAEEDLAKMLASLEGVPDVPLQPPVAPPAQQSPAVPGGAAPVPADDQDLRERASMGDEEAICELARREKKLVELAHLWEGEYSDPRTGAGKTWNVDTLCDGWLLRMYANWGDVAPWLLKPYNDNTFEWHNPMGGSVRLVFAWDAENRVPISVEMTDLQGETVTLERLGPPKEYE